MSNKIFRIEIIQPEFGKLFHSYESSFKREEERKIRLANSSANAFDLEKEKAKITAIKFGADFQTARTKWFNVKGILDVIHRKLPPVEDAGGVIRETINLNNEFLTPEQKKMLAVVLMHAYRNGAMSFPTSKSNAVISSEPVRKFVEGESIEVEDLNKFEDYKAKIDDLCKFIDVEGTKFTDTAKRIEKSEIPTPSPIPDQYRISIKDREIWVNDYLLSKPHAVGKNLDLFEFIRTKPKESIKKSALPDYLKNELKEKRFSKIFYELGFQGEILKAFFPKRGKSTFRYSGDGITLKEMEENGVKINQFLKELKVADIKNRPI